MFVPEIDSPRHLSESVLLTACGLQGGAILRERSGTITGELI